MAERLELRLTELAGELDWPRTPELAERTRERLDVVAPARGQQRFGRGWSRRRMLALGLAGAALGGGVAAAAGPPLLDLFRTQGVRVVRAPVLPRTAPGAHLGLGDRVNLDEARLATPFRVLIPHSPGLEHPDAVYVRRDLPGGAVSLLYRPQAGIPRTHDPRIGLLLTQFRATFTPLIGKTLTGANHVERTSVNGEPALWIEGDHAIVVADAQGTVREDRGRLSANALVWQRGGLTLRLEGRLAKNQALTIARNVR
jgi:hypothetical protein